MMITACVGCGYDKLGSVIDLGLQPLANGLLTTPNQIPQRYPLGLQWCPWCSLLQLTYCVDRQAVFGKDYPYRSGVSKGWVEHCRELAGLVGAPRGIMVDIGGNDGTAATEFRHRGWNAWVIDPMAQGDHTIAEFFSAALARKLLEEHGGGVSLILAQNVLAHVDCPINFMQGVVALLANDGVVLIECPHVYRQMATNDFTQIYHEHLTYWSLRSLDNLAAAAGLVVTNIWTLPHIHGGSVRYELRKAPAPPPSPAVQGLRSSEQGPMTEGRATVYGCRMQMEIDHVRALVQGETLWAIGASAKLATLLSVVGPNAVSFVVDDTPEKQGKYMPTGQPILPPQDLSHLSRLLIGAWNWTDALKERAQQMGFRGQYIVPFA